MEVKGPFICWVSRVNQVHFIYFAHLLGFYLFPPKSVLHSIGRCNIKRLLLECCRFGFKVCITNHSLCAWMIFKWCLETKDFLLRINVSCDSCCVLCGCVWETAEHILLHCPPLQGDLGCSSTQITIAAGILCFTH